MIDLHGFKQQCRTSEAVLKDVLRKELLEHLSTIVKNEVITADESDSEEIIVKFENLENDKQETNEQTVVTVDESDNDEIIVKVENPENDKLETNEQTVVNESDNEEIILKVERDKQKEDTHLENQILGTNDDSLTDIIETIEKACMESDSMESDEDATSDISCLEIETIENSHMESDILKTNENGDPVHKKNSQFTCGLCKKPFFNGDNCDELQLKEKRTKKLRAQKVLNQKVHIKKVHHQKLCPKLCEICGKFVVQYWPHLRMHSGIKTYECKVCFRQFGSKYYVNRHMVTHASERPYRCEICERG